MGIVRLLQHVCKEGRRLLLPRETAGFWMNEKQTAQQLRRFMMTSSSSDAWATVAKQKIDKSTAELNQLSQALWNKPQLKYDEHFVHKTLTDFLEKEGFKVERHFKLDTAFRATYGSDDGVNVCFICEYDALPDIGHACGHNLIAETGIAAGIAVKAALELNGGKDGKVTVMGTPAEEGGAGKVKLIEAKAFEGIHVAMMVHPKPLTCAVPTLLALQQINITFSGKPAHAAAYPWEGLNALDAAIMFYNSVSVMRQQMKPKWRAHGVITNGGSSPGIVPDKTEVQHFVRAPNKEELEELKAKVENCIHGVATMTGCQAKYEYVINYLDVKTNAKLAEVYQKHGESLGIEFTKDEKLKSLIGSTDMGNVSYEMPSMHPVYDINTEYPNHTREFAKAAGQPEAQKPTLDQAKAMALAALEIMKPGNEQLLQSIQAEFRQTCNK